MKDQRTQKEENMIKTAKAILKERGYMVTEVARDNYKCLNVLIENPHGSEYPDATGCVIFPSGRTSADQFNFHWS